MILTYKNNLDTKIVSGLFSWVVSSINRKIIFKRGRFTDIKEKSPNAICVSRLSTVKIGQKKMHTMDAGFLL